MAMLRFREALLSGDQGERIGDLRKRQILHDIAQAEEDLKLAWRRIDETTDADLIDSAIFAVKAAETRYSALVKMLKRE
ncbi:MAG: hypothetical protein GXX08_02530, partial [Firmicutes bacterium]|nr:hypothetical protein [Bacillota bacterium]